MTEILNYTPDEVRPTRAAVFESQGLPTGDAARDEIEALYGSAMDLLGRVAAPVAILADITTDEFADVYRGEGMNELRTPVGDIFSQATDLALFCVTLGPKISQEIQQRFKENDFAVASMLDSVASAAADRLADLVEDRYRASLQKRERLASDTGVLRYSPGYCGWHVSGQGKLFEVLEPEQVGVSLTETFLMQPLKSVSGVLLAGPAKMHDFANNYGFCSMCETQGCRSRIRSLLMK
ncbi:MAG: vitamin B12 dependent-methionine synthase activation domain-containing protein [Phycisphaerae bacterium]|jgi:hypothetical protein